MSTRPQDRLAMGALLACVCFIVYQTLAAGGRWECQGAVLQVPDRIARTDLLANVAGYMPLGFLGVMAVAARGRGARWVAAGIASSALAFGLSLGLELVQACQSARVSSILDVVANTGGAMLGATVAVLLLSVAPTVFHDPTVRWRGRRLSLLTLVVPLLWMLSQTLPWVFTLDVGNMRANLSFLRGWETGPLFDAWPLARHTTAWLALGCACRLIAGTPWRSVGTLSLVAAVTMGAQLLTQASRPLSFSEIGGVTTALVLLLPVLLLRGRGTRIGPWALGLALFAACSIGAYELEPGTRPGVRPFQWLPQVGLSRPIDVLDFALLFGWFGLAVTVAAHWRASESGGRERRVWPVLAVLVTVALEVAQLWVPGRGPDLSPPLLTALATLAATVSLRDDRSG